jgi:F0F1-type ATP synthase assembly protein I
MLLGAAFKCLLLYQSIVLIIVAAIFSIVNIQAGFSALLGGIAWSLPSFYFTKRVFRAIANASPQGKLTSFYLAEIYKYLCSAVLIILMVKLLSIVAIPFISGYIVALFSYWVISVIVIMRKRL